MSECYESKTYEEEWTKRLKLYFEEKANYFSGNEYSKIELSNDEGLSDNFTMTVNGADDNFKFAELLLKNVKSDFQSNFNHWQAISNLSLVSDDNIDEKFKARIVDLITGRIMKQRMDNKLYSESLSSPTSVHFSVDKELCLSIYSLDKENSAKIHQLVIDDVCQFLKDEIEEYRKMSTNLQKHIDDLKEKVKKLDTAVRLTPLAVQYYNVFNHDLINDKQMAAFALKYRYFVTREAIAKYSEVIDDLTDDKITLFDAKKEYFYLRDGMGAFLMMDARNYSLTQINRNLQKKKSIEVVEANKVQFLDYLKTLSHRFYRENTWYKDNFFTGNIPIHQGFRNVDLFYKKVKLLREHIESLQSAKKEIVKNIGDLQDGQILSSKLTTVVNQLKGKNANMVNESPIELDFSVVHFKKENQSLFYLSHFLMGCGFFILGYLLSRYEKGKLVYEKQID